MIVLQIVKSLFGALLILITWRAAIQTFIMPRAVVHPIVRFTFRTSYRLWRYLSGWQSGYLAKDALLAWYAPVTLVLLLGVWLWMLWAGFVLLFWGTGSAFMPAMVLSGSSLFTLGFEKGVNGLQLALVFLASASGMVMVTLLIGYLPTIYSAFSAREKAIAMLDTRAGNPPSAVELLLRAQRIRALGQLSGFWREWEEWFAILAESHTSLAILALFRSAEPRHNWQNAAGAVLDAAALRLTVIDLPNEPDAALCIRAGYLALRRIAALYQLPYHPSPFFPKMPISVTKAEFLGACADLAAENLPLNSDLEQAWLDFAGWRVNYDYVLLVLGQLVMAPSARWTGDRSPTAEMQQALARLVDD